MGTYYKVQRGDCLSSIAQQCGFPDYQTIYQNAANAGFREKRPNPNVIFPGDLLFIPNRTTKELPRPTDQRHRFVLKQEKVFLRLCLQDDLHQPYLNTKYRLTIERDQYEGTTGDDGMLQQEIPAAASEGEITIFTRPDDPVDPGFTFTLNLGHLDPVDEETGIDARLINLGFGPPDHGSPELSDDERVEALQAFQETFELEITGEADDATRQKLKELHDAE